MNNNQQHFLMNTACQCHPGQLSLAIPPRVGKMSKVMITAIAREETASSA